MRKPPLPVLLFVICMSFVGRGSEQPRVEPPPHPNHYILVIDASGSTAKELKKAIYQKALLEILPQHLYSEGFGAEIPPYNLNEDYLTLHHFGVVTGGGASPDEIIKHYNLSTDFIHPSVVFRKGVSSDELKARLLPPTLYQYTLLSWAKQIALHESRPPRKDDIAHRVFIIFVHDGELNGPSVKEEIKAFERDNQTFDQAYKLVQHIDSEYQFTDGRGGDRRAWVQELNAGESRGRVLIEAYEVISIARNRWEAAGREFRPVRDLKIIWAQDTGEAPEGVLSATLDEGFRSWADTAKGSEFSLAVEGGGRTIAGRGLNLPFISTGALSCDGRNFDATLNAALWQEDALLGRRMVNYTYPQVVVAPPPTRCLVSFYVWWGVKLLLLVAVAAALAYYLYYRLYATPLAIEIPGTLVPIPLGRRGRVEAAAPVVPQSELEALTLKLPGAFKQYLFCRGATVSLECTDGAMVTWAGRDGDTQLRLPLARDYMHARWNKLPAEPSLITVKFRHGRQRMGVRLSYPSAAYAHTSLGV
jgi:hypothetical protein